MSKTFRPYDLKQQLLFPPSLEDWVPEDHLARFVSDVVDSLDLTPILSTYETGDGRGSPPYHPQMMVKLLVYGYCIGVRSSRRLERATYDDVAFRFLSANQHPDHDSLAAFRRRHLRHLAGLFLQVLLLCQKAGLVKLGHVAIDGTKMKANASKHKAMSYGRMQETERRLEEEVRKLLEDAEQVDAEEDQRYGKRRGDELPSELARRESRLKKIQEAKAALEQEAKEKTAKEAEKVKERLEERKRHQEKTGKKMGGNPPKVPDPEQAKPDPKAQRNFTDPESRIMRDGATKGYVQAYNVQVAVDDHSQIVVATGVTQCAADTGMLVPVLGGIFDNLGALPKVVTADAGYYSDANLTNPALADVDLYIPPNRREQSAAKGGDPGIPTSECSERMRAKLDTPEGKAIYKQRKAIAEPVFGQTKDGRGFRQFLFRGFEKGGAEWDFICLTHNLLKLFRSGFQPRPGVAW